MSEVQVMEDHEVLVPLDRSGAEKLDGRIRRLAKQAGDQLLQVGRLLDEARAGRAHEALGFPSWTAYVADALGGTLQLSGEARQAMVQMMAGEGMSVRAIAAATGVSKSTVDRDLAQVPHDDGASAPESTVPQRDSSDSDRADVDPGPTGEKVTTGLDGKSRRRKPRAKKEPKQEPVVELKTEPVSTRQIQIPTAYRASIKTLSTVACSMRDLVDDPRWSKARDRFTEKDRVELDGNIAVLQTLRAAMENTAVNRTGDVSEERTA
ncbi:helix-turn-helix domain-containing protein [Mycolicibacterium gilvum]|uniref:Uncharacterized protein n=1 Tax=Mycolicibacterium gilvum TaxID=1804 RepID=A0A378SG71_9MYCO|nr:helix-turn-helix domain-containing protein [Mycolicibacterium gilvum]MCV7056286.1 hypothetical protein [Mycolicibacterium gilvum]STZ41710.1 Uncharacterised protein [Mycolicibacterium gilvum]